MKKIWKGLGSIQLTIIVLLLLVCDLAGGYVSLKGSEKIFKPLNDLGLIEWINTYGRTYPGHTVWLFVLFVLLFLLGINTFVCTTDRVSALIENRKHFTNRLRFLLKFSVHIIHYALIIILAGYLISYLYATTCSTMIIALKQDAIVPGTKIKALLQSMNIDYYQGDRLDFLNDRACKIKADLLLTADGKQIRKTIGINRPFRFNSFSFHLNDFAPRSKSGMKRQPYISLIVKKDPGMKLYFSGTLFFLAGLFMYLYQWFLLQSKKGEKVWKEPIAADHY